MDEIVDWIVAFGNAMIWLIWCVFALCVQINLVNLGSASSMIKKKGTQIVCFTKMVAFFVCRMIFEFCCCCPYSFFYFFIYFSYHRYIRAKPAAELLFVPFHWLFHSNSYYKLLSILIFVVIFSLFDRVNKF